MLGPAAIEAIIRDIVAGRYSDIDLAAFVTAFAGPHASADETIALTRAMIDTGKRCIGVILQSSTSIAWEACPAIARASSWSPSSRRVD